MKPKILCLCLFLGLIFRLSSTASAQLEAQSIVFNSFDGIYNLSRASDGTSLLNTEETILADFPSNSKFSGITRSIPKTYQNHAVDLKVQSVVDGTGNDVPFKTKADGKGSLIITTGDPSVILYGPQTFKIRYQAKGVINLNGKTNDFLLNTNGLGWSQPFGVVRATVKIAKNLQASLVGDPTCYINTGKSQTNNCSISTDKNTAVTTINSKAFNIPANQALVLKMIFKPSTFKQYSSWSTRKILFIAIPILIIITLGAYTILSRRNKS